MTNGTSLLSVLLGSDRKKMKIVWRWKLYKRPAWQVEFRAGGLHSYYRSQLMWISCTRKASGWSRSLQPPSPVDWAARTSGTADGASLTASLSPELTRSVPHCHSGHREAEFISRIRLAGRSRIVHWSVSRPTFPVPSPVPEAQLCSPNGWLPR